MALFPSTLILGSNQLLAESTAKELLSSFDHKLDNNPDIFFINDSTGWGIAQVRTIGFFLAQKPYSHQSRFVVIYSAQNLETEAQNALLKILEEPGENRYIILICSNKNQLLDTIISRCHLIFLSKNEPISSPSVFPSINSIKLALQTSDQIGSDKTEIKNILQKELITLHQNILKNPNQKMVNNIKTITTCLNFIDHHLDPKIALDYYLLKQISNS